MTERLIIDVGRVGDQFFCQLSGKQDGGFPFDINVASPQNGDDVKATGARIFAELRKNSEVDKAISRLLDPRAKAPQPIYINTMTVPAQSVWWEAVWGDPA